MHALEVDSSELGDKGDGWYDNHHLKKEVFDGVCIVFA